MAAEKTKSITDFIASPERDQCTGRLLSAALDLEREGYKHRHIKQAALTVCMDRARAEGFAGYRYFLTWLEELARTQRASLDECAATYDQAEAEGRAEEYLASL